MEENHDEDVISGSISALHPDTIRTHILTRLDGPTLTALSCASSQFHSLAADPGLWRRICTSNWPSIRDPRLQTLISDQFPSAHRSFFSDSFPPLLCHEERSGRGVMSSPPSVLMEKLISAVDLHHEDELVFSAVREMETVSTTFLSSSFRVELPATNVPLPTRVPARDDDTWTRQLEDDLTLSWIIIDPIRKRALNVSSRRAVSVDRDWFNGEVYLRYSTVTEASNGEPVELAVEVTCEGKEGGEACVKEVRLEAKDAEGRKLSGRDSLAILGMAIEKERGGWRMETEHELMRERYEEFEREKSARRERVRRREKAMDAACVALDLACVVVGFGAALSFSVGYFFR